MEKERSNKKKKSYRTVVSTNEFPIHTVDSSVMVLVISLSANSLSLLSLLYGKKTEVNKAGKIYHHLSELA